MNLATKIYKFKKAVWDYRGKYDPATGKWSKQPSSKAKARVVKGLKRLSLDVEKSMKQIDSFKNKLEFEFWIKAIIEVKQKEENNV